MSDEHFYPPKLTDEVVMPLRVAIRHARRSPAYLEDRACPWSKELKTFVKELAGNISADAGGESVFEVPNGDKFEIMVKELDQLYSDLKSFRGTLNAMEPNEKATFFKTSMSLMEKIVALKERIYNMKEISEFQKTVITVMEHHLDPEQQKKIIGELNGHL